MSRADELSELADVIEVLRRKIETAAMSVDELALLRSTGLTYPKTTVGEQARLDGRTPGMEVLRRHLREGFWPPTAWRFAAASERDVLGLSPREDVLAHVMFIPVGTGVTTRTALFRNPGESIRNAVKLMGEGAPAPTIHGLMAMRLLQAGGQPIQDENDAANWD